MGFQTWLIGELNYGVRVGLSARKDKAWTCSKDEGRRSIPKYVAIRNGSALKPGCFYDETHNICFKNIRCGVCCRKIRNDSAAERVLYFNEKRGPDGH